jgi:hypothetical protein
MYRYTIGHWFIAITAFFLQTFIGIASAASLPARVSANGYASSFMVGQADLMVPMLGSIGDDRHNLYLDPNVAYASNGQWVNDLGLGYRWVQSDVAVLGGYVFGSYTRLDHAAQLFVLNPGIEILASRWDFHLNGYFPLGESNEALGEVLGTPFFSGHSGFQTIFDSFQKVGNGGDVQVGYQLFPGNSLKATAGSYFFSPQATGNIWGGITGLEYWLDQHLKLFVNYSYDNLRGSVGAVGVGVELGGVRTTRHDPRPEERIMDPVVRYLAELGRGSAIPSRIMNTPKSTVTLANNIAFFSQSGGPNNGGVGLNINNCTFENPCGPTDLTDVGASTLSGLLPNTQLYFNGGDYNALDVIGGTEGVTLQAGQSLSSRTADYTQPASGAGRSIFNGALRLRNNNTLNNIILLPVGGPTPPALPTKDTGVSMTNATNVVINGSQIGSNAGPSTRYTERAIGVFGASQLTINNSSVFAERRGVDAANSSVSIQASEIDAFRAIGFSRGVTVSNNTQISINNSRVSAGGQFIKAGIFAESGSNVTITNTGIVVATASPDPQATGLIQSNTASIQMNSGALFVSSSDPSQANLTLGSNIVIKPQVICVLNRIIQANCP